MDLMNFVRTRTASLLTELDKKLLVVLRDGRTLIGELMSVDQFANLVLRDTIERIHVGDEYGDIERGVFIVRGENVVLLGEVHIDMGKVTKSATRSSARQRKKKEEETREVETIEKIEEETEEREEDSKEDCHHKMEEEGKQTEEDINVDMDDSDDEAPEGISLEEGKKRAQENTKQLIAAQKAIIEHKKKIFQDRELKNREQQKEKKTKIPEKINDEFLKLAADDTNEDIDDIVSSIFDRQEKTPVEKNQRIVFSDNESDRDFDEGFEDISDGQNKLPRFQARHLASVNKRKEIGDEAREFLKQHFYGDRLKRVSERSICKKGKIGKVGKRRFRK